MRPIKLTMTAFGPYSGVEIVDFRELKERNLFLITGPTGSGKTTLFDAISFAMYGEANGHLRSAESLRSQFSKLNQLTEVALEFELKGVKYMLHRTPKQLKPKRNGIDMTEHKPTAELTIYGQTKPIIGVNKVNSKIEEIVGINAEQFRQIMMIPQGEFRKLLTSDSQEREKVLQKLFDTSLYNLIQNKLDMEAKSISGEIKGKKQIRDHELERIIHEDEALAVLLKSDDKHVEAIVLKTDHLIERDTREKDKLESLLEKTNVEIEKAIKDRVTASDRNDQLKLRDALKVEIAEEEKNLEGIQDKETTVYQAEKSLQIIPIEEGYNKRKLELQAKKTDQATVHKKLGLAKENHLIIEEKFKVEASPKQVAYRENLIKESSRLNTFLDKVKSIEALKDQLALKQERFTLLKKESDALSDQVLTYKSESQNLLTQKDLAKDASIELLKKNEAITSMQLRTDKLNKLMTLERHTLKALDLKASAESDLMTHKSVLEELTNTYKKSKINFLMNQAAFIAKDLKDHEPCPVCGSLVHVQLASFTADAVSEEALEKIENKVKNQERIISKLNENIGVTLEKLKQMDREYTLIKSELELDDQTLVETLLQAHDLKLAVLKDESNKLKTLSDKFNAIGDQIEKNLLDTKKCESAHLMAFTESEKLTQEVSTLKIKLESIYDDVPEDIQSLKALQGAIATNEKAIKEANDSHQSVNDAYTKASSEIIQLNTRFNEMNEAIKKSEHLLLESAEELKNKISELAFESFESYREAKVSNDVIVSLKAEIEQYKKRMHGLVIRHGALEEKLLGKTKIDLTTLDEKISQLKAFNLAQNKSYHQLDKRVTNNKNIVIEVKKINGKIGKREKEYEIIGNLARISQGRNQAMITFERYVLAAFLDDILRAANVRLYKMTQGRYILSRTEVLERKNKQSGLELEIFDHYTGKSRHVKTLSGGEGFKASLSMALGLSDVVQAYSGGVRLDTMFIDEGFGTLDQESLDSAISCLIDLQNSGRLVGIISHVQELKERIDTRLEVVSTNSGSSTKFLIT